MEPPQLRIGAANRDPAFVCAFLGPVDTIAAGFAFLAVTLITGALPDLAIDAEPGAFLAIPTRIRHRNSVTALAVVDQPTALLTHEKKNGRTPQGTQTRTLYSPTSLKVQRKSFYKKMAIFD
jgi:hypothetical protein